MPDPNAFNDAPVVSFTALSVAPVGAEVRVNSFTSLAQRLAAITALTDGGYVVTWSSVDQDGDGYGVYVQRYDAAGAAVGGEIRVNGTTAAGQKESAIAGLADGGYVVTWSSNGQDGDGDGIYARRYDAAGVAVGGEVRVNSFTTGSQFNSSVTALADGGYVVAWRSDDQDGSSDGIYAQRYDAAGAVVGGEVRINSFTTGLQFDPSVSGLAGGGYVVTWSSDAQDGSGYGVYAQRYDATGAVVGGEIRVNSFITGSQSNSSVAGLTGGGFVVTWESDGQDGSGLGIYAQLYDASGAAVGGEILVPTVTASTQRFADVAALADGGFLITWAGRTDGSATGIFAQRFDASGAMIGGEVQVNTSTSGFQIPSFAAGLAGGGHVVIWESDGQDGDGWGVYSQRFAPVLAATEDQALDLKGMISVTDADAGVAAISVTLAVDHGILTVTPGASGAGVSGSGTALVTLTGTLAQIGALLDGDVTSVVAYTAIGDAPPADATLTVTAVDNGASGPDPGRSGDGSSELGEGSIRIAIVPVDDPAVAVDDTGGVDENDAIINGNVIINDSDPDGPALIVTHVNGVAAYVGTQISLASGALLELRSDGTYDYDPNGAFNTLTDTVSGAVNISDTDSFTYTLANGDTATVTITINGVATADDVFFGDATDNVITGTDTPDVFLMMDGGANSATGNGGNDFIYYGAGLDAADAVDGGAGTDTLALLGDYDLTLGANLLAGIERLVLYSGSQAAVPHVDYSFAVADAAVAAGGTLIVQGRTLLSDEQLVFNGVAETDGHFIIVGGAAGDILAGGQQADSLSGGGGDDQLFGRGGDDHLIGGLGADTLRGGEGRDLFRYGSAGESTAVGTDRIVGFQDLDVIDLSAIDANGDAGDGDSAFTFIGSGAFTNMAGQLRATESGGVWTVEGDVDGNGIADLVIEISPAASIPLTGADFVL